MSFAAIPPHLAETKEGDSQTRDTYPISPVLLNRITKSVSINAKNKERENSKTGTNIWY